MSDGLSPRSAPALLRELARLHVRAQREALARIGASGTACTILTELGRAPSSTLAGLSNRLRLDKGWTSRAVDRLVDDGLVEKSPGERDRRTVALSLTSAGRAEHERLEDLLDAHVARMIDRVAASDRGEVTRALRVLHDSYVAEAAGAGLEIRRAAPGDWDRIADLLSTSSLPIDGAREHVRDFLVASRDDEPVGCAAVERYGEVGLLRSVAVRASERGRATGRALVERCIADCRGKGMRALFLLTTTAEDWFPRFGFERIDRAEVPEIVQGSVEFQGACPASATAMRLELGAGERADAEVRIRAARRDDAAAIAAIYNAGIRDRMATFETRERAAEEIERWIEDEGHPVLVAERERRVVGWIAASTYRPRDCYDGIAEFSVYVAPFARGRGIGDALMRAFLPALEEAGFWKVLSRIFPENAPSLALCRRHGFREVGLYERHARLDGVWRDVVIVERLVGEAARP